MDTAALRVIRAFRIAGGAWLLGLAVMPFSMLDRLPIRCLFRSLTGRPCLGCGLTHSVWGLLHGQVAGAWRWNPLGFLALPLVAVLAAWGWPAAEKRPADWRNLFRFPPGQISTALRRAWAVVSLALALALLAPAALPASVVFRAAPVCQSKLRYGKSCPLCGMTHAFVAISRGRFAEAARENRASLPLYAGMAANQLFFAAALVRRRRARRASSSSSCPVSPDSQKSQPLEDLHANR
jgi:hypothetical protein